MRSLIDFLSHIFLPLVTQATLSVSKMPIECRFDVGYPNDTVFCRGYSVHNRNCTNAKECCKHEIIGCLNISVIQAYGMWQPPTSPASPCSRNHYVLSQGNGTNYAMDGHVIMYHKVVSAVQCGDLCLRQPRCRSFNLAHVSNPEKARACELLEEEQNVVYRPRFSYWLFDRDLYSKAFLSPHCSTD